MLIEIKALNIKNQGYKRDISLDKMYVNTNSVVSIVDYDGASDFLLREQSKYSREKFSLVKLNEGGEISNVIALGSAEQLFKEFNSTSAGKIILNG